MPSKQARLIDLGPIDRTYFERRLTEEGAGVIAGVDEVGRGCLAGPVVAAGVILDWQEEWPALDDSKKLSPTIRGKFYQVIRERAVGIGIGVVSAPEIDRINILEASKQAMVEAVKRLPVRPDHLLIDGNQPLEIEIGQTLVIKGDQRSINVSAASIVAKVIRDRMMTCWERHYPGFSFSRHKGYGTKLHMAELRGGGITPLHRRSFSGVG